MKKAFLLEIADAVARNGMSNGVDYDQWLEHLTQTRDDLQARLTDVNQSIEKAVSSKRDAEKISALLKAHAQTLEES